MKLVVFDLGGTEIKYSVIGDDLAPVDTGYVPTPDTSFEDFASVMEDVYRKHENEVEGIAISMGGFINSDDGICIGSGKSYNWGVPIGPEMSKRCGCPVVIENDGKCAALAEYEAGSLKGTVNSAAYVIGTFIGGGLILDGKILHGPRYVAGEFSFMNARQDWFGLEKNCCGNNCSTSALLREYGEEGVDGRDFFRRYDAGDEKAKAALDVVSSNIANHIASISNLLDLERVAIGGGICQQPAVLRKIQEKVHWYYHDSELAHTGNILPGPEVVRCTYGSEANQIGAYFAFRNHFQHK